MILLQNMSLIGKNVLCNLRAQPFAKYSTVANKVWLASSYNCKINSYQCEILKKDKFLFVRSSLVPRKTYVTSLRFEDFKKSIYKILDHFNISGRYDAMVIGYHWFTTVDQINYEKFSKMVDLPDSFYSWYKITELHVWMMLVKLMHDGVHLKWIRDSLITAMWEDAEKRAKLVEPVNKKFKHNFKDLYCRFKASLYIYDEGLLSNDMEFANALWYHFLDKKCEDPRILEGLVNYCRNQVAHLHKFNIDKQGVPKNSKIWLPLEDYFPKQ